MSADVKDQILSAVPIEVYIGRYVALKKAGKDFKGLCPFHGEKTPSFTVAPEKGLFHCFGCGRGGDLFRFVMEFEKVGFPEALDMLARFAGIERTDQRRKHDPDEPLIALNEQALKSFRTFLAENPEADPHRRYLGERKITQASIEHFRLGASPNRFDWLNAKFSSKHYNDLVSLGLLKKGPKEDRPPYDFYRGRIIFPIFDLRGRIVAFGGRILPDFDEQTAKYINSPDSRLFHKGRVLYGLYQAVGEIRSEQSAIIVEGYLDVIGLYQAGIGRAVAPLGTAITEEHLRLLARYTNSILCLFDGDRAGRQAALRTTRLVLNEGLSQAQVVLLPNGRDPFDLAQAYVGRTDALLDLLEKAAIPANKYFLLETMFPDRFSEEAARRGLQDSGKGIEALDRARLYYTGNAPEWLPQGTEKRPGLERLYEELSSIQRDNDRVLLLEDAAHLLNLNPTEVRREWDAKVGRRSGQARQNPVAARQPASQSQGPAPQNTEKDPLVRVERALLTELLFSAALFREHQEALAAREFVDPIAEEFFRHLEMRLFTGNIWPRGELAGMDLRSETMQAFSALLMNRDSADDASPEVVQDLLTRIKILECKKKIDDIDRRYVVADSVEQSYLIEERQRYTTELQSLNARFRGATP